MPNDSGTKGYNMSESLTPEVQDPTVPALAYLGDAVMELFVRTQLVKHGLCASAKLNEAALQYVKATAQSEALNRILPLLTEEEARVYHRGRNSPHIHTAPKSATLAEYRRASGMETLFGKLHLDGNRERIRELLCAAYPDLAD